MLSTEPGSGFFRYVPDYVVFDLETTGLSPSYDAIVEISAVKVLGSRITLEYSTLVNPERPIPWGASEVNHITDAMVAHAPVFRDAFEAFLDFAGDLPLVGHNIQNFDLKFLNRYAMAYWGLSVGNSYADTLRLARKCLKLPGYSLGALAGYFGISSDGAHRALADCRMNRKVYECLRPYLEQAAEERICPKCGKPMKKRTGRYGQFYGCTGYPECRHTEKI